MKLSPHALEILQQRYLEPNQTPEEKFGIVAKALASAEENDDKRRMVEESTFELMTSLKFLPNSPTLANAGRNAGTLSACFVLGIEDSRESIFETLKIASHVQAFGGGGGYDFSSLRPKGAIVKSTNKPSSGVLTFIGIYSAAIAGLTQAGIRNGANMGIMHDWHPDIMDFILAKRNTESYLSNFNLSVGISNAFIDAVKNDSDWTLTHPACAEAKIVKARDIWNLIIDGAWENGEPGVIFFDIINKARCKEDLKFGLMTATNPCVTGDTLVAVADGRNYIPIKQLTEEGKDIPVHCVDPKTGIPHIRFGRNPRLTRVNVKILKVTLDDGSTIRVTEDHKFLDINGNKIQAKDLVSGTRLMSFSKYQQPSTTTGKPYWFILNRNLDGERNQFAEHNMLNHFYYGNPGDGHITHHINGDSLDNSKANLTWISIGLYNKIEPAISNRSGADNPMFGRSHSVETKAKISIAVKKCFEDETYRDYHSQCVKDAMQKCKYKLEGERVERVKCICPTCNIEFSLLPSLYKVKTIDGKTPCCSIACHNTHRSLDGKLKKFKEEDVINLGILYLSEVGNLPTSHGWDKWTKTKSGMPSREIIRTLIGGFQLFGTKIIKTFMPTNHIVTDIQDSGMEDVYNITVDEFHTVAYITNTSATTPKLGMPKFWGLYTMQCGEQPLLTNESCNLGSINLAKFIRSGRLDKRALVNTTKIAIRVLDNIIDINHFPTKAIEEKTKDLRRIGLGVTGFADYLILRGIDYRHQNAVDEAADVMALIHGISIATSEELAKEKGPCKALVKSPTPRRNIAVNTIAPTGTLSKIMDCSSGIEPIPNLVYNKFMLNKVYKIVHPLYQQFLDSGKPIPSHFVTCDKIQIRQHVQVQAAFQKYTDNAVSKTIVCPYTTTKEEIEQAIFLAHKLGCKGLTFYRKKSRELEGEAGLDGEENKKIVPVVLPDRPRLLLGFNECVATAKGKMYININFLSNSKDHEQMISILKRCVPAETFIWLGKSGEEDHANTEAIGRATSRHLRRGLPIEELVKDLIGISSDSSSSWDSEMKRIRSIPDCLGRVLRNHLVENKIGITTLSANLCKLCGGKLISQEGCVSCEACGWSEKCS